MIKLSGTGVAGGIAVGKVKIRHPKKIDVKRSYIDEGQTKGEIAKFTKSINVLVDEIAYLVDNYSYSKEDKDILTAHKLILQDPEFTKNITYLISNELYSLEYAVHKHFSELIELFYQMENEYFAQRASDYQDVANRLLHQIMGTNENLEQGLDESTILVMEDIPPSSVSAVVSKDIRGLCLLKGSTTSHASIIARSLDLVTVVGIERITDIAQEGDTIIVDGNKGDVIINPDDETLATYRELLIQEEITREELYSYKNKKAETTDGFEISLFNNIEFPDELDQVNANNASGIGLFRTEFLYLSQVNLPTEEEQFEIYKKVALSMQNRPVIIRTIDIGGDKLSDKFNIAKEANPNLGLRGIRLSLRHPDIFKQQLKAILRASAFGNLKIMFPMISGISEFRQAKAVLDECKKYLKRNNIEFDENIPVGVMIEVPSAVIQSAQLAEECDFFSIGTNDLVQYTLAVDRDSENVIEYYNAYHPAVLSFLKMVIDNAIAKNIHVGICGELASDVYFVPVLIGLGIQSLSVSPAATLKVKKAINNCSKKSGEELVAKLLQQKTLEDIKTVLLMHNT